MSCFQYPQDFLAAFQQGSELRHPSNDGNLLDDCGLLILPRGLGGVPIFRVCNEIGMGSFVDRDSPQSVPEVGEVSVDETRLSGGIDADGRFRNLPSEVVLKVFLEVLLVPQVSRNVSHHNGSIAGPFMLIVYPHHRINGWLEEVLWVGVPILSLRPIGMILGGSKEANSPHLHKSKSYPPECHHPGDRDPEEDDEVHPKERSALRGVR